MEYMVSLNKDYGLLTGGRSTPPSPVANWPSTVRTDAVVVDVAGATLSLVQEDITPVEIKNAAINKIFFIIICLRVIYIIYLK